MRILGASMASVVMLGGLVSLVGCGSTRMATNGPPRAARAANCEFRMLTTAPAGEFIEVGAIDVQPGGYGTNVYTDLSSFTQKIAPYVCKAGGDAAIGVANGYGMYIKATILKSVPAPSSSPPSATTEPTPASTTASAVGCLYDTQCKGDRICVKH